LAPLLAQPGRALTGRYRRSCVKRQVMPIPEGAGASTAANPADPPVRANTRRPIRMPVRNPLREERRRSRARRLAAPPRAFETGLRLRPTTACPLACPGLEAPLLDQGLRCSVSANTAMG